MAAIIVYLADVTLVRSVLQRYSSSPTSLCGLREWSVAERRTLRQSTLVGRRGAAR
jgi:hypothetical protein